MDKAELRLRMKSLRSLLTPEVKRVKNDAVAVRAKKELPWQDIRLLHIYRSIDERGEVDTSWVEPYVHSAWPLIRIVVGDSAKDAPLPTERFDMILVPLLAFDDELNRIGYGGGWYDRFLVTQPQAASIGLAYETQHVSPIPAEPHDIKLSRVITDQRIYD
jgi:5-formyltetrahydrofolate cyclo-ligase